MALFEAAARDGARMLVFAPALQGFLTVDELVHPLVELAGRLRVLIYVHTGPHSHGAPTQVVLLAQRHPATRFILGYCGATDHAWDMPAILKHHALTNLWFELSMVRPWAVPTYLQAVKSDRLIFASASPRNDPRFELEQLNAVLPVAEHPDIRQAASGDPDGHSRSTVPVTTSCG